MIYLRFDINSERKINQTTDTFAPISNTWKAFIGNCNKVFVPSAYITVDEQLPLCDT